MKLLTIALVVLAGCATDGARSGIDTLPKQGEMAADPTIVTAQARCVTDSETGTTHLELTITGSDPMGAANLGHCGMTVGTVSDTEVFSGQSCYTMITTPCTVGAAMVVAISVSNQIGGVTTAAIEVTPAS